jgi:predicted phosphodiesterase
LAIITDVVSFSKTISNPLKKNNLQPTAMFTRRHFLCSVLTAVSVHADDTYNNDTHNGEKTKHWAFISDTHISGEDKNNSGKENPLIHLQKVLNEITTDTNINRLIICGDCAKDAGLPSDYRTLFDALQPLRKRKIPIHFVMGNHDERYNFLCVLAETLEQKKLLDVPNRIYEVIETEYVNLFLLDSLEKTRQQSGSLGKEQLDWLAAELDKRQNKPAVLVAHHYPDYTAGFLHNPHALRDTEELFSCIGQRKQVKTFFFGHSHSWNALQKDGIHLVNILATSWAVDKRQPLGWVHAAINESGMTLTLHSLDKEHPKHLQRVRISFAENV